MLETNLFRRPISASQETKIESLPLKSLSARKSDVTNDEMCCLPVAVVAASVPSTLVPGNHARGSVRPRAFLHLQCGSLFNRVYLRSEAKVQKTTVT